MYYIFLLSPTQLGSCIICFDRLFQVWAQSFSPLQVNRTQAKKDAMMYLTHFLQKMNSIAVSTVIQWTGAVARPLFLPRSKRAF